ncbi:MAG: homoserine dehydrogenase [Lachnospiraceae bacterium]|nr:homoserine dehydrogenase [Lachnospiraceae bacterium]
MKVAVMGYGTIGSGVVEVLQTNANAIARHTGEPLELKSILDIRDFAGDPIEKYIVHDYMDIANDPEIRLVVETMGGVEPAYNFVKAMLLANKHVATSNKALVADKGAELIKIAREHKVNFMFEASVGGGIPIIRPILKCMTGDVMEEITGIVNGTTNYMLTKMANEGSEFDTVLKEAQDKGYAEKDPTADVDGHDACRKIAILTSLVSGRQVDYTDIPTEGIRGITPIDFRYAKALDRNIKLLATSQKRGDTYAVRVAPYMLSVKHPLTHVDGVFNAIFVHGNMLGDAMFYGSGAGKLPTASAVVGDLVEMAKHDGKNVYIDWSEEKLILADADEEKCGRFIRTSASREDIKKAFSKITFVDAGISGENGFLTEAISDIELREMTAGMKIIQMIRLA